MDIRAQLLEELQSIFCPPLDSSLVAAILLDIDPNTQPSKDRIDAIHATLEELAAQADVLQLAEDFSDIGMTDDLSTPSFTHGETSTSNSGSEISQQPFSTPFGFLQAAFPEVERQKLDRVLSDADPDDEDFDMWDIVSRILSEEYIHELEERGLDGLDEGRGDSAETEDSWQTVGKKTRSSDNTRRKKKQDNGRHKVSLVDVRQQHHALKPHPKTTQHPTRSLPAPDPWTQISSLSTHLSTLLPSHQPSFFTSHLHSPKFATPYTAIVEALQKIAKAQSTSIDCATLTISLLDILLPLYDNLDPEQRSRLVSDIELSLTATQGRAEEALDLVQLLRDLDQDSSYGYLQMGIYHQPIEANLPSTDTSRIRMVTTSLPSQKISQPSVSPDTPLPALLQSDDSLRRSGKQPSPYQWQTVPKRKTHKTPHPHASFIPAYTRDVNGMKVRGSGNGLGKGGKGDVGELKDYRKRIGDSIRKRDEMLREASRMWQRGNAKTRGGEIALYFAERAREFQDLAKQDALEAARMMVESKRISSKERDTIDLHGTTVAEATIIASEILASMNCSPSKPLKIVTGRGTHSANQVSVLKPALRKALVEDGWSVSAWDGGLVSRHRRKHKRRKTEDGMESSVEAPEPVVDFQALLDDIELESSFEDVIGDSLPEYILARKEHMANDVDRDDFGVLLRRLTRAEITSIINDHSKQVGQLSIPEAIVLRKLKLERERRRAALRGTDISTTPDGVVEGLVELTDTPSNTETVEALENIRRTSYGSSFISRLYGNHAHPPGLMHIDWDTETPWMKLMQDIREHYHLLHPDRDPVVETRSPIIYTSLQSTHLPQIHDILSRSFWQGIDVSDSLEYNPEKCTVVASYNNMVVGVAIMSSPRETYITYLAVKHGWDSSNIATTMLYHLIILNPGKDITLHVSVNNPAMLLYNRFGFKSEEFIAGFYDAYLDPESRASKNAVRLRLRHH
ncbi:hypothetical protein FB446DRAFT_783989 [Lentinula raphanica]|nr:hypothetical protein FB446DRAFT_783989 [Lentinula raphanica]